VSAILLDSRVVHYEVLGRGRPVIFLHSWVGSWRYWVPAMQSASISFRAYALDLWGYGDSAREADRYALEQQAALLSGFLNRLGIARVVLVGHGLGGLAAILFTRNFPGMVERLMLVDCPLDGKDVNARLGAAPPAELSDWLLARNPEHEPARLDAPKADPQAIFRSLKSLDGLSLFAILEKMKMPCLLVHGQGDPLILAHDKSRLETLPEHVHQIILEQAGHFPMLDDGARFNRLLADFLALESGASPRQLQLKEEWKRRLR